jgi:hypothetical protein
VHSGHAIVMVVVQALTWSIAAGMFHGQAIESEAISWIDHFFAKHA